MPTFAITYHPGYKDETRVYVTIKMAESAEAAVSDFMKECCATTPLAVGHLGAQMYEIEKVLVPSYRITGKPFQMVTSPKLYKVTMTDRGEHPVQVIKAIRTLNDKGLQDAIDRSKGLIPVAENVTYEKAQEIAQALYGEGGLVRIDS